jgi:hypothetical protein
MTNPVDLAERLSLVPEHWSPKVVARHNDYEIKVVKVKGEFVWHTHDDTDELFLVLDWTLTIHYVAATSPLMPASCSWCPEAKSIARLPMARFTRYSSSRPEWSTREAPADP